MLASLVIRSDASVMGSVATPRVEVARVVEMLGAKARVAGAQSATATARERNNIVECSNGCVW